MQNKKYKALYKCRVCGHTYSSYGTDDENLAFNFAVDALNGNPIVKINEIHRCEDGGIGIADFCGVTRDDYSEPHCDVNINIDIDSVMQKVRKEVLKQIHEDLKNNRNKAVDVDNDSVLSEKKVKTLEEIYQMLGLKGPCFSYQKINNAELEPLFERVLNGKNDFVAFYTENQKGYAPKLVICEKQDIENIRNSLKNNLNIRVVSAGAFCNGITLLEVHELLESDLKEIKE